MLAREEEEKAALGKVEEELKELDIDDITTDTEWTETATATESEAEGNAKSPRGGKKPRVVFREPRFVTL